jgi:ribosomal-protein-alanine N-acetyltransferase
MFAAYGRDAEVAHYLTWRPHTCVADSEAVIGHFLDSWRDGCEFHWLLFRHGGSELIGATGVRREAQRLDRGYVLARRHWGYAFMAEALTAVVDWAFTEPSVFRIGALCDIDDRRSARVLERAGFEREGILEGDLQTVGFHRLC